MIDCRFSFLYLSCSCHKMDLVFNQIGLSSAYHLYLTFNIYNDGLPRPNPKPDGAKPIVENWENDMHSRCLPHEAGWENAKSVQSCHQGKGLLLWRISNIKYIFICFNTLLVSTWFHMCYLIVFMSSLLFYYVDWCCITEPLMCCALIMYLRYCQKANKSWLDLNICCMKLFRFFF